MNAFENSRLEIEIEFTNDKVTDDEKRKNGEYSAVECVYAEFRGDGTVSVQALEPVFPVHVLGSLEELDLESQIGMNYET